MPIYEYQCNKCGEHFEVEQRMVDDPIKTHEACGGDAVKVFSSAGIVLKGSGFYKTDARSGSSTKKAAPKADSNKADSSSSKTGSDNKKADTSSKSPESKAPKKAEN